MRQPEYHNIIKWPTSTWLQTRLAAIRESKPECHCVYCGSTITGKDIFRVKIRRIRRVK